MARIETTKIRNIALVGHEGAGKTILVEAFLHKVGMLTRMGTIKEGNTASDFDQDEREGGKSFSCSTLSFTYKDTLFNVLDVPGSSDCVGDMLTALRAVECALICVDATSGVKVNTRKIWQEAEKLGLPCCFAITRLDAENTNYAKTLAEIQEIFGDRCIPAQLPDGSASSFSKVFSVVQPPDGAPEEVSSMNESLSEAVVEADDELMEKYLEGEEISDEVFAGHLDQSHAEEGALSCAGCRRGATGGPGGDA